MGRGTSRASTGNSPRNGAASHQTRPFLGEEAFGDWRQASFTTSTVFHAALLLYEAGERDLAERFLTHLTEGLSRTDAGRLGDFALELGDPHIALGIAKRAAQNGHEIMRAYYPVTELAEGDWPVDAALALSIARRESEFDPSVISHAGAMGLMQVMPGTGRDTAAELGIDYDLDRVLADPDYNALLATSYIAGLNERFDGNVVLVSAGYNAGPRRASEWIDRFGDPPAGGCRRDHLLDRGDPLHRDAELHHARDRKPRHLRGATDR